MARCWGDDGSRHSGLGRLVGRRLLRVLVGAVVGLDDEGVSLVMGSSWAGL